MQDLHAEFRRALDSRTYAPLLLCAAYVLDFTVIHPFRDGNGRMSRLITLWLLYIIGHDVGRYISLEKLIDDVHRVCIEGSRGVCSAYTPAANRLQDPPNVKDLSQIYMAAPIKISACRFPNP